MTNSDDVSTANSKILTLTHCLQLMREVVWHLQSNLACLDVDLQHFYGEFDVEATLLLRNISLLQRSKQDVSWNHHGDRILELVQELSSCAPTKDHTDKTIHSETNDGSSHHGAAAGLLQHLRIVRDSLKLSDQAVQSGPYVVDFKDARKRDNLLHYVSQFAAHVKPLDSSQPSSRNVYSQPRRGLKNPSYDVKDAAAAIYEAFRQRLPCDCSQKHSMIARVALSTHRRLNADPETFDFEIILCLNALEDNWKETFVRAEIPRSRTSVVRFIVDDGESGRTLVQGKKSYRRQRVDKICQSMEAALTGRSRAQRLNFELMGNKLYKTQSTNDNRFPQQDLPNVISLGQLISSRGRELGQKVTRILAVMFSYAVLHLSGSPWLDPLWDKDQILFIRSNSVIPLRPYIFAPIDRTTTYHTSTFRTTGYDSDDSSADPDEYPCHPYPELVALGVLLIELHHGVHMEDLAEQQKVVSSGDANDRWFTAQMVYDQTESEYTDAYRAAISACLDPNFGSELDESCTVDIQHEALRRLIYERIISPLEDELERGFGERLPVNDLDAATVKMDLLNMGRVFQRSAARISSPDDLECQRRPSPEICPRPDGGPSIPNTPEDRAGFEIALICALTVEANAILAMFDVFWDQEGRRYGQAPGDCNAYTTGAIGEHNVVLAISPGMGKSNASAVAAGLRSSFPNIKLGLLVGVCAGVPSPAHHAAEIYLGDLIVSTALIQYDFGRQLPGAFVKKTTLEDSLPRPSQKVWTLLNKLKTDHHKRRLQDTTMKQVYVLSNQNRSMAYPGAEQDYLYSPSYIHKHHNLTHGPKCTKCDEHPDEVCQLATESTCQSLDCDPAQIVRKRSTAAREKEHSLEVHFGRMGTGDAIMRSGLHRDRAAQDHEVIGFEMEGAGVWDQFPSIVIKGVCDYADSHKNKVWQPHAAAVAAAGMKALLAEWPSDDISAKWRRT